LFGFSGIVAAALQQKLAFEVASVRPGELAVGSMTVTDTRVDIRNYTLFPLIRRAFGVPHFQIVAPDWLREARAPRFTVQATFPAGASRDDVPEMLKSLLIERFGLEWHVEARPIATYALLVGPDGPRMLAVEALDELTKTFPIEPGASPPLDTTDDGRRVITERSGVLRYLTSRTRYDQMVTSRGTWQLDAARMTMPELADRLSSAVDRPVIDKTGLTGIYQFKIELPRLVRPSLVTSADGKPISVDPSGGSAFDAVKTLGLRLEAQRSPLDVVVVDRINRIPTEN
jgi:uncharacterized protein (TIGR03435 family)